MGYADIGDEETLRKLQNDSSVPLDKKLMLSCAVETVKQLQSINASLAALTNVLRNMKFKYT